MKTSLSPFSPHSYTHGTARGRRYVQLPVGKCMRAVKVIILALFKPDGTKTHVVPVRHLRSAAVILLPFNGKYAAHGKKPKRDWSAYKNAWQWMNRIAGPNRK